MTDLGAKVVITPVSDSMEDRSQLSLSAALCVDHDALDRFGVVVRHLLVGLVDQAVHLRVISADARIEQLTDSAATTSGTISVDGEEIGQVDLVFSHIDQNMSGLDFPEHNFVFTGEFKSLLETFRQQDQRITL